MATETQFAIIRIVNSRWTTLNNVMAQSGRS